MTLRELRKVLKTLEESTPVCVSYTNRFGNADDAIGRYHGENGHNLFLIAGSEEGATVSSGHIALKKVYKVRKISSTTGEVVYKNY